MSSLLTLGLLQVGSFKYTREVIAQLQVETSKLIDSHGGNPAIAEIVQYLAAKVFAEEQLPRRPGTPVRPDGGKTLKTSTAREQEPSGNVMLTLSADYHELDNTSE